MRRNKLKIIMGASGEDVRKHAVKLMRELDEHTHPTSKKPHGVATHLTRFPIVCDDCGETFWASEPYSSHAKCRRSGGKFGF